MVRIKQRYILCELQFDPSQKDLSQIELINDKYLQTLLKHQVQDHFGDLGYAQVSSNFVIKFWNPQTKLFILRVSRDHEQLVTNSMIMATNINNMPARIRILHVSGTLQKLEENMKAKSESFLQNYLSTNENFGNEKV